MKKKMKYQAGGQMIDLALAGLQSTASGIANLKQNVDSGDFKKKNLFGKYADIMGATPMGMIANPILQPLAQAFASPDKTVISGSPGMYNTGGPLGDNNTVTQFDWTTKGGKSNGTNMSTEESGRSVLAPGSRGKEVEQLQAFLHSKGMYKGNVDGIYGEKTKAAVEAYQKWFNQNASSPNSDAAVGFIQNNEFRTRGKNKPIAVDGVVGDETRSALMYRQMPEPTKSNKPKLPEGPFPLGESQIKYNATDNNANAGPVEMDYFGGLAMLGLAAAPGLAGSSIPKATSTGVVNNSLNNLGSIPKGFTPKPLPPRVTTPPGAPGPRSFAPQTPSAYGTRIGFATGGDLNLSSDAMKIQGNPNVTDGNQYGAVALDHNEVVTQTQQGSNFVFSHDLKDPITGKPFAQLAEKQSRAKGRAEKMLEKYPFDEQAKSTISLSNATLNHVSNLQEAVASKLGLRNSDGSTKQKFASGGPIPYQGFNVLEFQKLYNQNISSPNAPLTEDNLWGPKTSEAYNNYAQTKTLNRQIGLPFNSIPETVKPLNETVLSPSDRSFLSVAGVDVPSIKGYTPNTTTEPVEAQYKTPWTFGDTLKGVELIGKSIGAFGKPEVDKPLIDRTQITKEAYDPTNALYQTNRTYNLYKNSLNTPSINLNRALSNSALAGKYSQDNQTLSQYDAMNKSAQTQYQQRAGQQAQFNVQSQFRTNDINAANRAAQDAVQQNFYSSVGQFGEDLNRKKYAADIINLYRNQVPDVFDSYIKSLMKTNGQ